MKFYSLVLFGVLCALSSMGHAEQTAQDLAREWKNTVCRLGEHKVTVRGICEDSAETLEDCHPKTIVGCLDHAGYLEVLAYQRKTPEPAPTTLHRVMDLWRICLKPFV